MDALPEDVVVALAGLAGGIALGLAVRMGRFCTLGTIEDAFYGHDRTRLRMWGIALATAIAGTFAVEAAGLVDPAQSIYFSLAWSPAGAIAGGLMFGYGMALSGACGFMALARAGGGDIRAVVIVLVIGISAYMAIGGPTAALRDYLLPPEASVGGAEAQGIAHALGAGLGIAPIAVALIIAAGLALAALVPGGRRPSRSEIAWSAVIGLAIVWGWAATGWLSETLFTPVRTASHTFAAPIGESLIYVMTSTGASLGFGVGSVAGVIVGASLGSLIKREFRWEACDDPRELRRQILGAFLMGTGGVVALGCSIGQGLTAFSALAVSAPVVLASIVVGARLGLYQLLELRLGSARG